MSLVQLKTELRQELKLTPQLMQSMEVLQMTSQELLEYLSRQAEENPLLDQSDPPERAYEELRRQAGWIDGGVRDRATFAHEEAAMEAGREDSRLESLAAFLRDQIHRLRLSKPLTALCQYLAELVDEDGYLAQEDLDGLASMRIPQALTDQALDALQGLDPPGVGARSLSECLLLQLSRREGADPVAMDIAARFLPELGRKHYAAIAQKLRTTVEAVRAAGGRYLFLTNNSSRSVDAYVEKLGRMGVAAGREDFLTSVDALIADLAKGPGYRKCYVFGTESFRGQLREAGVPVTDRPEKDVDCLLIGFDTELTFQKLEDSCILLGDPKVDFIATNPDWVCPTAWGSVPDCGSVCEMLFRATGRRPKVIGKPEPEMALLAMDRWGCSKEETVLVGDRIYTDIACGVRAGIDTAFVLSGEGVPEDIEKYGVQPSETYRDIREILEKMD